MQDVEIKNYILSQSEIEAPSLQKQFSISYGEVKSVLDELEKDGKVQFKSGVVYTVNKVQPSEENNAPYYNPQSEYEAKCINALWVCIKFGSVNVSTIQRRCSVGYSMARNMIDWMEQNGYISEYPMQRILISRDEFIKKFGNPEAIGDDDEDTNAHAGYKSTDLLAHLGIRRESDDDDDDDGDENDEDKNSAPDVKTILISSVVRSVTKQSSGEYVIGIGENLQFLFEYKRDAGCMRLSDGGTTMMLSPMTERRIKNALKKFPQVGVENKQLYITFFTPHDTFMSLMTLYAAVEFVLKLN